MPHFSGAVGTGRTNRQAVDICVIALSDCFFRFAARTKLDSYDLSQLVEKKTKRLESVPLMATANDDFFRSRKFGNKLLFLHFHYLALHSGLYARNDESLHERA